MNQIDGHQLPCIEETFWKTFKTAKMFIYGTRWYETLDQFLTKDLGFIRSRVEGCLFIERDNEKWIKMIKYVDDALYYSNDDEMKKSFEKRLSKKPHLLLMEEGKCQFPCSVHIREFCYT